MKFHDLYDDYVVQGGSDVKNTLVSYRGFIELTKNVFPSVNVEKRREHSKPIMFFSGMIPNHGTENGVTHDFSDVELKTVCADEGFTLMTEKHRNMCQLLSETCCGQRIVKEVRLEERKVIVQIAGKQVSCPDLLPEVSNLTELAYILHQVSTLQICHGMLLSPNSVDNFKDIKPETWSGCAGEYVRANGCCGLLPKPYRSGMCVKCTKKKDNICLKRPTDHEEHSYSVQKIRKLNVPVVSDSEVKVGRAAVSPDDEETSDSDIGFSDNEKKDPTYDPYKLNAISKEQYTPQQFDELTALLQKLAPSLSDSFVELIKIQIKNSTVKDCRLRRWDLRFISFVDLL